MNAKIRSPPFCKDTLAGAGDVVKKEYHQSDYKQIGDIP